MEMKYSNDRATQILLSLLKSHGIKKVIASPGTTNISLVGSIQYDKWFEVYSSVDERSAAYMACGMAAATGETVVITCTGATASRNYLPGLTEAFYRKLPVLAITGSHGDEVVGHLHAQSVDRTQTPRDTVRMSVTVDRIDTPKDEWATIVNVNKALLELRHHGGGPVHINLRLGHGAGFTTEELPATRVILRYMFDDIFPDIKAGRVALFIGAHRPFDDTLTLAIDKFCSSYNAVVFCDITSGYNGKFKLQHTFLACQHNYSGNLFAPDLLIHLGEVSGEFYVTNQLKPKQTWRISEDGEVKDLFGSLTAVFEMQDITFFDHFANDTMTNCEYLTACQNQITELASQLLELPFGNIWIAQQLHDKLPNGCIFHTSILNSLRSWNFYDIDPSIQTSCNVGGFGIDGPISTLLGSSLAKPDVLHLAVVGDLAFFYDLNSLGNRHVGKNLRILLINNGRGAEFSNYDHPASQWGEEADAYMAAGGHYGRQSKTLIKHYAEDLGFEYISASSKDEFQSVCSKFVNPKVTNKPLVFEVFTSHEDESEAIMSMRTIIKQPDPTIQERIVYKAKRIINKLINN